MITWNILAQKNSFSIDKHTDDAYPEDEIVILSISPFEKLVAITEKKKKKPKHEQLWGFQEYLMAQSALQSNRKGQGPIHRIFQFSSADWPLDKESWRLVSLLLI